MKGWLSGPLQQCEVPDSHPISRRFGLLQKKGKMRLIDDYTESGVNTCVTTVEAPVLHTIDVACVVLALWFGTCEEFELDSTVVARTFDLTSAYRQVALSREGKRFLASGYLTLTLVACNSLGVSCSLLEPHGVFMHSCVWRELFGG